MIDSLAPYPRTPNASFPQQTPSAQTVAAPAPAYEEMRSASAGQHAPTNTLTIELDSASNRFVQTLMDASDEVVLRRYPNASQLAFSRGINAYTRAMQEAQIGAD